MASSTTIRRPTICSATCRPCDRRQLGDIVSALWNALDEVADETQDLSVLLSCLCGLYFEMESRHHFREAAQALQWYGALCSKHGEAPWEIIENIRWRLMENFVTKPFVPAYSGFSEMGS